MHVKLCIYLLVINEYILMLPTHSGGRISYKKLTIFFLNSKVKFVKFVISIYDFHK